MTEKRARNDGTSENFYVAGHESVDAGRIYAGANSKKNFPVVAFSICAYVTPAAIPFEGSILLGKFI